MFEKLIVDFVVVSGLGISACHLEFGLNGKAIGLLIYCGEHLETSMYIAPH